MSRDWTQEEFNITGNEPDAYEQMKAELAKVKQQLAIAVEALETIEKKSDKFDDSWSIQEQLDFIKAEAQSKLYQIKELEK